MFNPKLLATGGFYPGLITTQAVANLGTFTVEVIIQPVVPSGGGGWVPAPLGSKPDRYRVTVRVKHNGKIYTDSAIVDDIQAKVYAKLNGITFSHDTVMISVNGIQQFDHEVNIQILKDIQ